MALTATSDGVRAEHVVVPLTDADRAGAESADAVLEDAVLEDARLSFDNGLERLDIASDESLSDLLEARFAAPWPVVWVAGHNVHLDYPLGSRLLRRMGRNTIRVNPVVAWSLDVHGGAAHLDADLSAVAVRSLSCHAAVAHSRLTLGRPQGLCTIRMTSVKDLRIERPADVPVRLEVVKGAKEVALDDRRIGAVGGGLADQTTGYRDDLGRYLVLVAGAADTLTIAPRVEPGGDGGVTAAR